MATGGPGTAGGVAGAAIEPVDGGHPAPGNAAPHGAGQQQDQLDRRLVSVLFADIVGSTRLVSRADPEDARDQLDRVLACVRAQVARFGGTLCQTMGDGLLAVFGAPHALEDHEVRACFAAQAIVREAGCGAYGPPGTAIRVGVSTGEIVWDAAALNRNDRPPAVGRPVHLAAKLQQSTASNTARVCAQVARAAADWADLRPVGPLDIGSGDLVEAADILGTHRRRLRRPDTVPLVGRDGLLRHLDASLDAAAVGRGGAHLLVGAPGVGKTRIASEIALLARARGFRLVDWVMHAVRPAAAAEPVADIVATLQDCDLPETATDHLCFLRHAGADPEAAAALSVWLAGQSAPAGDSNAALVVEGVVQIVLRRAAERPVLLLVEDLHWAGAEVLAIVARLARAAPTTPILIVATSRSDLPALSNLAAQHPLAPLGATEARALLDQLLGPAAELDGLKRSIARRAQGNPFFVRECVRRLVADGVLTGDPGNMCPGRQVDDALPGSVRSLLAARVDSLDVSDRDLLLTAAVIGPGVDTTLLAALLQRRRQMVVADLARLARDGYLENTRILPRLEYSFQHPLLHETAYATLTNKQRRSLHGGIVRLLETPAFADFPARDSGIARHAYRAEDWPTALAAGTRAGQAALGHAMASDAAELLEIAVNADMRLTAEGRTKGDPARAIDLRTGLGRSLILLDRPAEARDILRQAHAMASDGGDRERECGVLTRLAFLEQLYGNIEEAARIVETTPFPKHPSHPAFGLKPRLLIGLLGDRGDIIQVTALLDRLEALESSEAEGAGFRAVVLVGRARCLAAQGDYPAARMEFQRGLALAEDTADVMTQIYCLGTWSIAAFDADALAEGLSMAERTLAISRRTDFRVVRAMAHAVAGGCLAGLGRAVEAGSHLDEAEALSGMTRLRAVQPAAAFMRAVWAAAARRMTAAEDYAAAAAAAALETGRLDWLVRARRLLADFAVARGDRDRARDLLRAASVQAGEMGLLHHRQAAETALAGLEAMAMAAATTHME